VLRALSTATARQQRQRVPQVIDFETDGVRTCSSSKVSSVKQVLLRGQCGSVTVPTTFLAFLPRWTVASAKSFAPDSGGCMSIEVPARPTCPACGSTKVGTLAREITKDTAWRCASCGETFKAPKVDVSRRT